MKLKIVSINARGLQSPGVFLRFLQAADKWRREGIGIICVQEHNFNPDNKRRAMGNDAALRRTAGSKNWHAFIGYAPAAADGVHWGGTMVLCDMRAVSEASAILESENATRVSFEWNGRKEEVVRTSLRTAPLN